MTIARSLLSGEVRISNAQLLITHLPSNGNSRSRIEGRSRRLCRVNNRLQGAVTMIKDHRTGERSRVEARDGTEMMIGEEAGINFPGLDYPLN